MFIILRDREGEGGEIRCSKMNKTPEVSMSCYSKPMNELLYAARGTLKVE